MAILSVFFPIFDHSASVVLSVALFVLPSVVPSVRICDLSIKVTLLRLLGLQFSDPNSDFRPINQIPSHQLSLSLSLSLSLEVEALSVQTQACTSIIKLDTSALIFQLLRGSFSIQLSQLLQEQYYFMLQQRQNWQDVLFHAAIAWTYAATISRESSSTILFKSISPRKHLKQYLLLYLSNFKSQKKGMKLNQICNPMKPNPFFYLKPFRNGVQLKLLTLIHKWWQNFDLFLSLFVVIV